MLYASMRCDQRLILSFVSVTVHMFTHFMLNRIAFIMCHIELSSASKI